MQTTVLHNARDVAVCPDHNNRVSKKCIHLFGDNRAHTAPAASFLHLQVQYLAFTNMIAPLDPPTAAAYPKFDALYQDLTAKRLNADGTSKLNAKAANERDILGEVGDQSRSSSTIPKCTGVLDVIIIVLSRSMLKRLL